ncbi:MAG: LysR family transcriptional regulator [Betaproteobacteria bacterium]|nr:LysR family transcriptional regulator [Betaproteobacteria bacterium]
MDKLNAIRAFAEIAAQGNITRAADVLDVSQPALVRTLAALERALGVRLLQRTTRRMSLTDEGREYLEHCHRILAAVDEAESTLTARQVTPRGRLRITSSVSFGRQFVAPVVAEFLAAHSQLTIDLMLLDRVVDLVDEGIDLAVRVARLPDSSMIAHAIGETRRVVVASTTLLKGVRVPKSPSDLQGVRVVCFSGVSSPSHWEFGEGRARQSIAVHSALVTNQLDAALDACAADVGFGRFLDYHVLPAINAGKLVRVLQRFESDPIPAHIVYPSARHPSPNVRAFVEFARPRLRERLARLRKPRP